MRQKLLYFLITLCGAITLVSGYQWYNEIPISKFKSFGETQDKVQKEEKKTITEVTIYNELNNTEQATTYDLPLTPQKIPTNTTTEPLNTTTTTEIKTEETFETKVTLQINGKSLLVPYQENISAEGVMKEAHSRYPESFWYESIKYGGDLGTFVQSINGISENNREKMYWILYINGKKSNKGISILKLNPDDIIMWNYEKEIL